MPHDPTSRLLHLTHLTHWKGFFWKSGKSFAGNFIIWRRKKGLRTIYMKLIPWFGQEQETNNYESINHWKEPETRAPTHNRNMKRKQQSRENTWVPNQSLTESQEKQTPQAYWTLSGLTNANCSCCHLCKEAPLVLVVGFVAGRFFYSFHSTYSTRSISWSHQIFFSVFSQSSSCICARICIKIQRRLCCSEWTIQATVLRDPKLP
jgi:hypothetical protein